MTPTVGGTTSLTDGDTLSLTCTTTSSLASGDTYKWYLNGGEISGQTSSSYSTTVSLSHDGNAYTCAVIFNSQQSDTSSNTATLTGIPNTNGWDVFAVCHSHLFVDPCQSL